MSAILILLWIVIALATGRSAANRHRSQWGGILFGLCLGPLALALVMLSHSAERIAK